MTMKESTKSYKPTMLDMMRLPEYVNLEITPDGTKIAYLRINLIMKENTVEFLCYVHDLNCNRTFQITKVGRIRNLHWLDNETLAVLAPDKNNNSQIFIFEALRGEGRQITFQPNGVRSFKPFDQGFLFMALNSSTNNSKKRIGNFIHCEEEESNNALFYTSIAKAIDYKKKLNDDYKDDKQFILPVINVSDLLNQKVSLQEFLTANSDTIYLNCRLKDDLNYKLETSQFRIQLNAEEALEKYLTQKQQMITPNDIDGQITEIALPKGSTITGTSPDGSKIIIRYKRRDLRPLTQSDFAIFDIKNSKKQLSDSTIEKAFNCITQKLDREPQDIIWNKKGIFISYHELNVKKLAKITEKGEITPLDLHEVNSVVGYLRANENGDLAIIGASPDTAPDIYKVKIKKDLTTKIERITSLQEFTENWDFGILESINWKSKDGLEINGILRKPSNFDPKKKYPIIVWTHGGPFYLSPFYSFTSMERYYYPTIQFCNKDILILMPNYRGSLGQGQQFREMLEDNMGVGDQWDVESGLDYLIEQGFIDESKIGAMGWSQGGYISAFLGMHSNRFKAVSVGAGVSSWYTYYISSDLRYSINISGTPIDKDKKEIYNRTAPISGIETANTPMLIQHGEKDERISLISAKELYRSLKEKGVQTELFIFTNMGHNLSKPRELYSLQLQNYRWFMHHFFGEELDFFKDEQ